MSLLRECTPKSSCTQTVRAGVKKKTNNLWVKREIKKAFVAFSRWHGSFALTKLLCLEQLELEFWPCLGPQEPLVLLDLLLEKGFPASNESQG